MLPNKNNVTVLTVVASESDDDSEYNNLIENVSSLVTEVQNLTKCVKEIIDQKTVMLEKSSNCICDNCCITSSSNQEFRKSRKPKCLIDISKDVSLSDRLKDGTNVDKGRIPARSSCTTNKIEEIQIKDIPQEGKNFTQKKKIFKAIQTLPTFNNKKTLNVIKEEKSEIIQEDIIQKITNVLQQKPEILSQDLPIDKPQNEEIKKLEKINEVITVSDKNKQLVLVKKNFEKSKEVNEDPAVTEKQLVLMKNHCENLTTLTKITEDSLSDQNNLAKSKDLIETSTTSSEATDESVLGQNDLVKSKDLTEFSTASEATEEAVLDQNDLEKSQLLNEISTKLSEIVQDQNHFEKSQHLNEISATVTEATEESVLDQNDLEKSDLLNEISTKLSETTKDIVQDQNHFEKSQHLNEISATVTEAIEESVFDENNFAKSKDLHEISTTEDLVLDENNFYKSEELNKDLTLSGATGDAFLHENNLIKSNDSNKLEVDEFSIKEDYLKVLIPIEEEIDKVLEEASELLGSESWDQDSVESDDSFYSVSSSLDINEEITKPSTSVFDVCNKNLSKEIVKTLVKLQESSRILQSVEGPESISVKKHMSFQKLPKVKFTVRHCSVPYLKPP